MKKEKPILKIPKTSKDCVKRMFKNIERGVAKQIKEGDVFVWKEGKYAGRCAQVKRVWVDFEPHEPYIRVQVQVRTARADGNGWLSYNHHDRCIFDPNCGVLGRLG